MKKIIASIGSIVGLIALIAFAGIGNMVGKEVGSAVFSSKLTESEALAELAKGFEQAAKEANAGLPIMVDDETRMERVAAGPGAMITYYYTFPSYASTDVGIDLLRTELFPLVKSQVCANKDMRSGLEYGGTFVYHYSGNDGVFIGKLPVDREVCGIPAKKL